MHAITCSGYGRPTDVLHLDEVEDPTLGDGQVLVAVHAAALDPANWHLVRGTPHLARLQIGLRRPGFRIPGGTIVQLSSTVAPDREDLELLAGPAATGDRAGQER